MKNDWWWYLLALIVLFAGLCVMWFFGKEVPQGISELLLIIITAVATLAKSSSGAKENEKSQSGNQSEAEK